MASNETKTRTPADVTLYAKSLLKENTLPIWIPPSLANQPGVPLSGWAAFKVLVPEIGHPTAHLVGFNEHCYEGRVSSPLKRFDVESRCGVTSSGRVYRLLGQPGLNGDGAYVWERWVGAWNATVFEELSLEALDEFVTA